MEAGYQVMSDKGIDSATMQEIAELADVGAGTVYSYFKSKDELAVAVMERVMHKLALRIKNATLAGRFSATDADLTWMMACYAIAGVSLAVSRDQQPLAIIDETVVRLLCMAGLSPQDAAELAARPRRALPKDQ